ncbi:MAG: hypothetical protein ABIL01_02885 [Pseudomonadota bacterium]
MSTLTPEDLTTPSGLFNYARSYWRSAEQLRVSKPTGITHPDAPVLFLLYHAIELYLKAMLRSAGHDLKSIKDISHRITKAGEAAQAAGLYLSQDDTQLLGLIDSYDNVVRSRYITTGAYSRPEEQALGDFCEYLDQNVGQHLLTQGHSLRATRFTPPVAASTVADLSEGIETLSGKEREILAYLLHHQQRMFTCALDGGHAATLMARGIVRKALKPGQAFDADDMPVEIPIEVWRFLRSNVEKFPYYEEEDAPYPWRKGLFE